MPLTNLQDIYSKLIECFCSTDPSCQRSSAIFDVNLRQLLLIPDFFNFTVFYVIPGSTVGCSQTNSLSLSTLECFYSGSDCYPILQNYIQQGYQSNYDSPAWSNITPLTYQ
jgi:hypothetical protein